MKVKLMLFPLLVSQITLILTACQSQSLEAEHSATEVPSATQQAAQAAVDEGSRLYEGGYFLTVINLLTTTKEINLASQETQIHAHKLLAFSYCANGKKLFCRDEFLKILAIDPSFKLSESEKHHPMWGPVFDSARKQYNL
ncbi:TssQ family T6SS-associated lipoprotein [Azotobacter armeniacus]